jgi:hypothetical protein
VIETTSLRTTNLVVVILSYIGGGFLIYSGLTRCVESCEYSFRVLSPDPLSIGLGLAGILSATLVYQIIKVFASHVELSNSQSE